MGKLRAISTVCVAIVVIPLVSVVAYAAYKFWELEAPRRAEAAVSLAEERKREPMYAAIDRLEQNGAVFGVPGWGKVDHGVIDLTFWHAELSKLNDLSELALIGSPRAIRIGPKCDSSVFPILERLTNLQVLDLHGAQLTADDVEPLLSKLPHCRIGDIERDY